MTKLVDLTWDNGEVRKTERCYLVEEMDELYLKADGERYEVVNGHDFIDDLASSGMVLFEDLDGIFGMHPDQIVRIDVIEEDVDNG